MSDDRVKVSVDQGVLTILMNRAGVMNALDTSTYNALADAIRGADRDDIGCVVIGSTSKNFSAGWDLNDDGISDGRDEPGYQGFMTALESCAKPVVAAVGGVAIGIGFTMLGHVDMVVFGTTARLKTPFVSLGLCPEAGSSVTLPRLLGDQLAAELFYTGRWLGANEAVAAGLGLRVVADDDLLATATELAGSIARQPTESLLVTKTLLTSQRRREALVARKVEDERFARLLKGPAHAAAISAWTNRSKSR